MASLPDSVDGMKKLLIDKVKQYESKLAALNAINSALQKENEKAKNDLAKAANADSSYAEEELEELKEEFRERLGVAERAVETLKDEKARLLTKLSESTAGGASSGVKISNLENAIASLKKEGDTLSRKNGELEGASRKLRSTNRDLEVENEKLSARVKLLETQLLEVQERAVRAAQDAMTQIDELEAEVAATRLDMKKQVAEAKREAHDAATRAEELSAKGGEQLLIASREREAALMASLNEARTMLEDGDEEWSKKEEGLRRKTHSLEERIRQLEGEREDIAASATDASRPLLKQIESMAAASAASAAAAKEVERKLLARLKSAEAAASEASSSERAALSRATAAEAAALSASAAALTSVSSTAELRQNLEAAQRNCMALQAERDSYEKRLEAAVSRENKLKAEFDASRREAVEKVWDAEQRVRTMTVEREELMARLEGGAAQGGVSGGPAPWQNVPQHGVAAVQATPSVPLANGVSSEAVAAENGLPPVGSSGQAGGGKGSIVSDEELDSLLKTFAQTAEEKKNGLRMFGAVFGGGGAGMISKEDAAKVHHTVEQLRQRLVAAELARDQASDELCKAIQKADQAQSDAGRALEYKDQVAAMEKKVDIALELLGERHERIEQLQEDIDDMRIIFRQQLEVCVDQLNRQIEDNKAMKSAVAGAGSALENGIPEVSPAAVTAAT